MDEQCKERIGKGEDPELNKLRRHLGVMRIRCQLPLGHEGNHLARTKTAKYEWWNYEKNPQRPR